MTMSSDQLSRLGPWNFQPRARLGSTFSPSRLEASGSVADAQLSNQCEQQVDRGANRVKNTRGRVLSTIPDRGADTHEVWSNRCFSPVRGRTYCT
jgi:hypothetical protein